MSAAYGTRGLRARLERWVHRLWFTSRGWRDRWPIIALWPLERLVCHASRARRRAVAQRKALGRPASRPPVVVVGNLVVGGTGKTPLIIALTHALQARGWHPGIIAAGYGSAAYRGPVRLVDRSSLASEVGDEPLLMARRTSVPVVAGGNRLAALTLASRTGPCDLILADDGLQHGALPRDLELAVFDSRGAGNGHCLPAGPLREPLSHALLMDALLLNGQGTLSPVVHSRVFHFQITAKEFVTLDGACRWPAQSMAAATRGARLHALAGVGAPQRFFATLTELGIHAHCHALADHAPIDPVWLNSLDGDWLIMTEKDAVKCHNLPPELQARCLIVQIEATLDDRLIDWLEDRLRG